MPSTQPEGFKGLASLASEVDAAIAAARRARAPRPSAGASGAVKPTIAQPPYGLSEKAQGTQSPSGPNLKWILGIGGFLVVAALMSQNSRTKSPQYTPPSYEQQSETPAVEPAASNDQLAESAPPVGDNRVLSAPQIRYCLAEGIRLEAARSVVDATISGVIAQFNAFVDDYNIRCSSYRYSPTVYARIQADVQASRAALEAQGVNRFSAPGSPTEPEPAIEPPPAYKVPPTYEAFPSEATAPSTEDVPSEETAPSSEGAPSDATPPMSENPPSSDSLSPSEVPFPAGEAAPQSGAPSDE